MTVEGHIRVTRVGGDYMATLYQGLGSTAFASCLGTTEKEAVGNLILSVVSYHHCQITLTSIIVERVEQEHL